MRRSFEVEEWNISIRWSLRRQPIDYEHGYDSYVLSGRLMLEVCHSTSGEPQSVNPYHYRRFCWHCLIIIWWSTTSFRSYWNQNFCLANPKLLAAAGPWHSYCAACMSPSWMTMAGPSAGSCQGVAQPKCRRPCRNSTKRSCLPWISTIGSLQLQERYHNTMTEASP